MRKNKFLILLGSMAFTILVLFNSCRKHDFLSEVKPDKENVSRFLLLPASASPQIKRIAAKLQKLEDRSGLVTKISTEAGFAVWDKAIVNENVQRTVGASARSANSPDTIIYIPLVLENANHVNAFIYAVLNDTVRLSLFRANDYSGYGFGTLQDSATNAEKIALQFMLLDFETFGHSDFKVLDDRLLKTHSLPTGTLIKDTKVHIEHLNGSVHSRGSGFEVWEYQVCTSTRYLNCSSNTNCCTVAGVSPGSCNACEGCWKSVTTCVTTSILVAVDDGWYPSGGGGPPDNGGGGPGDDGPLCRGCQCNPFPLIENGFPPCPKGSSDGWMPELETMLDINILGDFFDDPTIFEDDQTPLTFDYDQDLWPTISKVIPLSQFVEYNHTNCLDLAKEQISKDGVRDLGYGSAFKVYDAQGGPYPSVAKDGINYIITKLQSGKPVIVGIDNRPGTPSSLNADGKTDHFVVIVGSGEDSQGKYLSFFDNATNLSIKGANSSNKLYYDAATGIISGQTACTYSDGTPLPAYTVTQIRKNK